MYSLIIENNNHCCEKQHNKCFKSDRDLKAHQSLKSVKFIAGRDEYAWVSNYFIVRSFANCIRLLGAIISATRQQWMRIVYRDCGTICAPPNVWWLQRIVDPSTTSPRWMEQTEFKFNRARFANICGALSSSSLCTMWSTLFAMWCCELYEYEFATLIRCVVFLKIYLAIISGHLPKYISIYIKIQYSCASGGLQIASLLNCDPRLSAMVHVCKRWLCDAADVCGIHETRNETRDTRRFNCLLISSVLWYI